ncbi:alkaline phosphatase [Natrialba chahannaoensis JCM 10990]|uniref:Alkaline phosphatase n=1 Tax=Natrialba chahannaoensis JCM 10990 TaxID=1227492 RepID=M0AW89_9EURY|nr:alkaline phosphatase [Natrialba chahannaoensis]ELZ02941.1 alkaline phosphatase [Natrialba chahannaoensis JCM 10990]
MPSTTDTGRNDEPTTERASTARRTFMAGLGALAGSGALGTTASARDGHGVGGGRTRNVILLVPDGGSRVHDTAARYYSAYQDDPAAFPANIDDVELGIDRADAVGSVSTYPDDPDGQLITDSGAAGTAIATGQKTYPTAISVDHAGNPIETVLERAAAAGYATGLVTTTQLTHATPAAFATHVRSRGQQEEIARQYVREQDVDVDVLLGGDRSHFRADSRKDHADLIGEAEANGYQYVETADELAAAENEKILGLFTETGHFDYSLDRTDDPDTTQPTLPEMTVKAIEVLESRSRNGFFLMVEGGRVDHAGHANDPAVVPEQVEHDAAVNVAMEYADGPGFGRGRGPADTLVVTVADHETGGLVLARDSYHMDWEPIVDQEVSQGVLAAELEPLSSVEEVKTHIEARTGIDDLSTDEANELLDDPSAITGRDSVVNRRAGLGWRTDTHSATDVPVYAKGPDAIVGHFGKHQDNTDLVDGFDAHLNLR